MRKLRGHESTPICTNKNPQCNAKLWGTRNLLHFLGFEIGTGGIDMTCEHRVDPKPSSFAPAAGFSDALPDERYPWSYKQTCAHTQCKRCKRILSTCVFIKHNVHLWISLNLNRWCILVSFSSWTWTCTQRKIRINSSTVDLRMTETYLKISIDRECISSS